jgi:hypothetical protein
MLYEFKSKATGNLIMTQSVGDQVLDLIGKRSNVGVITVLEMPMIIQTLQAAITRSRAEQAADAAFDKAVSAADKSRDGGSDDYQERQPNVTLAQRLVPFIEMLERSHKEEKDVVWGV